MRYEELPGHPWVAALSVHPHAKAARALAPLLDSAERPGPAPSGTRRTPTGIRSSM
ncbi:hypothetical protein ACFY8C_37215 [Streptomyces flavochromogenes]|uniref:Uncharacterized protein n=1 Tax=Streptomyces flavochromogenes TaxID=68199 RepID=A0ABW6Y2D4_9ACTN